MTLRERAEELIYNTDNLCASNLTPNQAEVYIGEVEAVLGININETLEKAAKIAEEFDDLLEYNAPAFNIAIRIREEIKK